MHRVNSLHHTEYQQGSVVFLDVGLSYLDHPKYYERVFGIFRSMVSTIYTTKSTTRDLWYFPVKSVYCLDHAEHHKCACGIPRCIVPTI